MVDCRPRSVVLNLFYISYPFIKQDHQIYPNTLNGAHLLKIWAQQTYSLEWFIQIYIGCNLWFNKFTPLEHEISLWLSTTGLGKYLCCFYCYIHFVLIFLTTT